MDRINNFFQQNLQIKNEYITTSLSLVLILYAGYAAPELPKGVAKLLDNVFVKLLMFFGLAYVSNNNPVVALISAVAILVTLQTIEKYKTEEKIENILVVNNDDRYVNQENQGEITTYHQISEVDDPRTAFLHNEEDEVSLMDALDNPQGNEPGDVLIDDSEDNYRNNFYPQHVNSLPKDETYHTRTEAQHAFNEPNYSEI